MATMNQVGNAQGGGVATAPQPTAQYNQANPYQSLGGQLGNIGGYTQGQPAATNLQQLYAQLNGQVQPQLANGQQNINYLQGQQGLLSSQQNIAAGAQQASTGFQLQQLGLSGANIGIQGQGLAAQGIQSAQQQGYEQSGYALSQQQLRQQGAQNTQQYGYQQAGNRLAQSGLSQQFGLAQQQYGTNLANLNYQLGVSQQGATSQAVASGALNSAGFSGPTGTLAQLGQQYGVNLSSLQNQMASTQQQYEQSRKQLGLSEKSETSGYQYGQSQLASQTKQAQLGQASEVSGFKYSQSDLNRQKETLSNIASANGVSISQAQNQLQTALSQMGISDTMDTAGLLQEINQAQQGQASTVEGIAGPLSLYSGLGGIVNQPLASNLNSGLPGK